MEILIIFFLILLNGIFSMSEIALISARKNRLETSAKKGNKNAQIALELANSPNKFLSTVQIGITLIGILTGIYSGDKITFDVETYINNFEILKPYAHSVSVGIVVVVLTFFSMVLGELLPKRIGLNHPESIAKTVALPMKIISVIMAPFIWMLTHSTEFLLSILQIKPTADGKVTEEEIRAIIKEGTEGGEVQEIEQDIVERVFHIGDRKINSLMTHRKSVVFLPFHADKEQVREFMLKELHSIYPVYGENYDDIVGVVNLKNIFAHFENQNFNLADIMTEAPFMMEQTTAYVALENFKKTGIHYAFVSDEYGVFQGVITLNDILEALVGDASDFYKDDFQLIEREDGTWLVDGHYSLHDFLTYFELDELINDYEVTTVSGLIMTELSHIPKQGEKLIWQKFELEVIDMDGVKIDKVMVKALKG
ncbi:HlyC/CorC family transporter [Flavobacterium sp. GSP27]|uniref:hemolysin family protein n=1 Tax=unclassified Flavobacterium TaxID=196869 RepID=UPI000F840998|nr:MULTISPECIES: hemolysin family protein [unclassified Flavobacterium]RTY95571.1 HlyC/CorC family transporter [Flavobacterium sp. GSN2]RTY71369.1 HlyC/CorC family transporter [Flavobacterium sp. LB2P53]RTY83176.1 HlyC/CorC family transporter [Flavobacterium sp. ZB4P23]RTZ08545.1 HlyC/CorC family transporter [Flavobacterium sp. GSP6]RTZ09544.1 HlyC/CorC family transporter [Flavobacterium sp. GSP27]